MSAITIGRAAHATRRAASAATRITYIGDVVLGLGWVAVVSTSFNIVGRPLPTAELVTLLSALIVGSLLVGLVHILRGPGFIKALRVGEVIGEERARLRAERATAPSQRVGATTG